MQELDGNTLHTRLQPRLPKPGKGAGGDNENATSSSVLDHPAGDKTHAADLAEAAGSDEQVVLRRPFGKKVGREVCLIGKASVLSERFPSCIA